MSEDILLSDATSVLYFDLEHQSRWNNNPTGVVGIESQDGEWHFIDFPVLRMPDEEEECLLLEEE